MDLVVTRRGLLNAVLPGVRSHSDRAIAVHADEIGIAEAAHRGGAILLAA